MEEPTATKTNIKLTPGNRRQKGRRSAPKAELRLTGKPEPYAYTFKDKRVGVMKILNSSRGWWIKDGGRIKLQKLVDAFCFDYIDVDACSYAEITEGEFKYFQKLHPEFYTIKERSKNQPAMHAQKLLVETAAKDPKWAAWYLERRRRKEFGANVDVTSAGETLNPQINVIQFVDFTKEEEPIKAEIVEPLAIEKKKEDDKSK